MYFVAHCVFREAPACHVLIKDQTVTVGPGASPAGAARQRFGLEDFLTGFGPICQEGFKPFVGQRMIGQFFDYGGRCGDHVVITSAPMRALSVTWFTVRIDAARISVSNPKLS